MKIGQRASMSDLAAVDVHEHEAGHGLLRDHAVGARRGARVHKQCAIHTKRLRREQMSGFSAFASTEQDGNSVDGYDSLPTPTSMQRTGTPCTRGYGL